MVRGRTALFALAVVAVFLSHLVPSSAQAQTWSAGPPIPTLRALMGAASIGSTVYAIGGMVPVGGNISIGKVEALDTTTGLWSTKAPLPEPVSDTAAVAIDGKIYLMGGSGSGGHTMANVHVYDAAADSWSTPTTMPIGRRLHSAAVLNGKIYVIGGVDVGFNFLDAVDVYDPASNTWSSAAP